MRNGLLGALEESASFIAHCNGNVKGEKGRVGEKEEERVYLSEYAKV